jgi:hypothetical protein
MVAGPWVVLELLSGYLSSVLGLPRDQMNFVVGLLIQLPVALGFRLLPRNPAWIRHLCSAVCGFTLIVFLFGSDVLHSFLSSLVVYVLLKFLPVRFGYKAALGFAFFYVVAAHVHRMWVDWMGWNADHTSVQMVLTIKLTSLAFSYHDGQLDSATLDHHAKEMRVPKMPSLLEYYGWVYFFPGILGGPATEYAEYRMYNDGSLFKAVGGRCPFSVKAVLRPFLLSVGVMALLGLFPTYDLYYLRRLILKEYVNYPLFKLLAMLQFLCFLQRCKYYFVWAMGETASNAIGTGFSGVDKDGKPEFNRMFHFNILKTEFPTSLKEGIDNWNIRTEHWLRHYVFDRLEGRLKPWSLWITFLVSALWHGLYPGYYLSFFSIAFHRFVSRMARNKIRPRVLALPKHLHPQFFYDIVTCIFSIGTLQICYTPFLMLSFTGAISSWVNTKLFFHIPVLVGVVVLPLIPSPRVEGQAPMGKRPHDH